MELCWFKYKNIHCHRYTGTVLNKLTFAYIFATKNTAFYNRDLRLSTIDFQIYFRWKSNLRVRISPLQVHNIEMLAICTVHVHMWTINPTWSGPVLFTYTVSVIKLAQAKKLARFFTKMVWHEAETFLNVFFTQIIVLHLVFKESF
jgi:hypothetical protein